MDTGVEPLAEGDVHVWFSSLTIGASRTREDLALLSCVERERAASYGRDEGGQLFIARRAVLRRVLAEYAGCRPEALRFALGAHGKPRVEAPAPQGLRFNMSHSAGLMTVAVADRREVGVDIERIRLNVSADDIVDRYFSATEAGEYRSLPPDARTAAFFATWTRKEAFVKALGTGLSTPLDCFTVSTRPDAPATLRTIADGQSPARWYMTDLSVGTGYAAALVVSEPCGRLRCRAWSDPSVAD